MRGRTLSEGVARGKRTLKAAGSPGGRQRRALPRFHPPTRARPTRLCAAVLMVLALLALLLTDAPETGLAQTPVPTPTPATSITVSLDMDTSDGPCTDIDSTANHGFGESYDVALCVSGLTIGQPVGAFQFDVLYDDTLNDAPEIADVGYALDDNPDANAGTTFWGDGLGSGWDCSGAGLAYPKGDKGNGDAFIVCWSVAGTYTLGDNETSGVLAVIHFQGLASGVDAMTIANGELVSDEGEDLGTCNPTLTVPMTCNGGTSTISPTISLDMDSSDGPCTDIDSSASHQEGDTYNVGVCVSGLTVGRPVGMFTLNVFYDDTLSVAPEVADVGLGFDDNPDASLGVTYWGDGLGTGWDCSVGGLVYPVGDYDAGTGPGHGKAFIECASATSPQYLGDNETAGVLAVIQFRALSTGVDTMTIANVELYDDTSLQMGSCNPLMWVPMQCNAGTTTILPYAVASPDTAGDVGLYTSLELDAGGRPVVSYWDETNFDLKVLHCGNADCTAGNSITSPDTAGGVGEHTSLALDASGNPVVSYYDATNDDLKVLHCNDANCAGGNESITSPDTDGGAWASLVLDAGGNPVVAYSDTGPVYDQNLKVMHCNDPNCAGGDETVTLVDTGGVYFSWISLALDAGGNPVASYMHNWNPSQLKVLHCGNADCTSGNNVEWADSTGDTGWCTSLALDGDGNPVISYHEGTSGDNLKVMHCNDPNCSDGNESITSPDTEGSVGSYTSLALDTHGNPVVSYGDWGNGYLKLMHCNDPNCVGGDESIYSPDTVGAMADWDYYTSLELDGAGNPVVSYHDVTNGDLKVLHCDTPTCGPPVISTVAGAYDDPGFVDGDVDEARLDSPHGVYKAADGSLLVSDTNNDAVRKVDPETGDITTIAGLPPGGTAGCEANPSTPPYDGCPATQATLSAPRDVFDVPPGDTYIADTGNNRIRMVDGDGIISTIAGNGTAGYSGDGGAATEAKLSSPSGVAVDTAGNVYIGDTGNNRIRKVDATTGIITTVAGSGDAGYSGDGGAATDAELDTPRDVYPWGAMYAGTTDLLIADTGNNVIRWVHGPSGIIDTLAGTGDDGFSGDGGAAVDAELNAPEAVASDASLAVYVADTANDRIRRVTFGDATISTIAGGGEGCEANTTPPYDGCPATDAVLDHPAGVATGSCTGSDTDNEMVREIDCATGLPVGGFTGTTGCTYGTVATIDAAFWLLPLGLILGRKRIGALLSRRRAGRP